MSSQPKTMQPNNHNGLYVPVHRRSPSPTSGSWRSHRGSHTNGVELIPSSSKIYSIPYMLQLSSSPLARLSQEQERELREHLYLPFAWKSSKLKENVTSVPTVADVPAPRDPAAPIQSRQNFNRRRSWTRGRRNVAELGMKRRNGWSYGLHPNGFQTDWRHIETRSVVSLGA